MSHFWRNQKVLVTGGGGFIGSHLVEKLIKNGARVTVLDANRKQAQSNLAAVWRRLRFLEGDCRNIDVTKSACADKDIVMNLAARVAGIEFNRKHHATMMRDNLEIASSVIEAARLQNVKRFLVVSSACVYPHNVSVPTPETGGFIGEPEETNEGYGWAKRMAEKLGMYYAQEFDMKVAIVRPYNCYGPRDHFDPEISHVIAALIKRMFDGENPVIVWGSGKQSRSFLYVEDLAKGMMLAVEHYPCSDPVNIGTNEEVTIAELVNTMKMLIDPKRNIRFDMAKPDGSPRRSSDNKKAETFLHFKAHTSLAKGLQKTVEWYRAIFVNK